ncbi:MAG: hypothetical protein U5P10_09250 [Spirochaetia bacterium]|nr:hypothetical protein [Spirochaetia bacterium]
MKSAQRTRTLLLIIVVVTLSLISLSACTGGSRIEVSTEWEIVTEGLAFNRGMIAVPAGEQVVIQLKNSDNYTHYFGVYRTEDSEQALARDQLNCRPMRSKSLVLPPPKKPAAITFAIIRTQIK